MSTKRILVPIDYNDLLSQKLVMIADQWASHFGGKLFFLHVTPPLESLYAMEGFSPVVAHQHNSDIDPEALLERFLKQQQIQATYHSFHQYGIPYREIVIAEEKLDIDLTIMGAHSKNLLERLFLGSNADYVLHHSKNPLLIFRDFGDKEANNIIVPIAFNEIDREVIQLSDKLAQIMGAKLHFIHVAMKPMIKDHDEEFTSEQAAQIESIIPHLQRQLENFVQDTGVESPAEFVLKYGEPREVLLSFQKELNTELVMLPAHSHKILDRWLAGSTTDYLLHNAPCSIYVHKKFIEPKS